MKNFQEALFVCDLSDIPAKGPKFTWSNNQHGFAFTKEKLDRVVANLEALELFLGSCYSILPQVKSDHSPLIINISDKMLV